LPNVRITWDTQTFCANLWTAVPGSAQGIPT
jgi:hypothetical protein